MEVICKVSLGELVDKLSILKIKQKFINDPKKLDDVAKEAMALEETLAGLNLEGVGHHLEQLIEVNTKLWKIEDDIREKERSKEFDEKFIELARAVYVTNDERFARKNRVNETYGSELKEVKSYEEY